MNSSATTVDSGNDQRAPWWWRLMQLLTALAAVAYLLSAAACAPHDVSASTTAEAPAAATLGASPISADAGVVRLDHSVVNRTGVPESPEATGASVAAYAP